MKRSVLTVEHLRRQVKGRTCCSNRMFDWIRNLRGEKYSTTGAYQKASSQWLLGKRPAWRRYQHILKVQYGVCFKPRFHDKVLTVCCHPKHTKVAVSYAYCTFKDLFLYFLISGNKKKCEYSPAQCVHLQQKSHFFWCIIQSETSCYKRPPPLVCTTKSAGQKLQEGEKLSVKIQTGFLSEFGGGGGLTGLHILYKSIHKQVDSTLLGLDKRRQRRMSVLLHSSLVKISLVCLPLELLTALRNTPSTDGPGGKRNPPPKKKDPNSDRSESRGTDSGWQKQEADSHCMLSCSDRKYFKKYRSHQRPLCWFEESVALESFEFAAWRQYQGQYILRKTCRDATYVHVSLLSHNI